MIHSNRYKELRDGQFQNNSMRIKWNSSKTVMIWEITFFFTLQGLRCLGLPFSEVFHLFVFIENGHLNTDSHTLSKNTNPQAQQYHTRYDNSNITNTRSASCKTFLRLFSKVMNSYPRSLMMNIHNQKAFPFPIAKYTPRRRSTLGTAYFNLNRQLQFLNYGLAGTKQTLLVTAGREMLLFVSKNAPCYSPFDRTAVEQ